VNKENSVINNEFFLYVLKYIKRNIIAVGVSFVIVIIYVFGFMEKYYTASSTILPPSSNMVGGINSKLSTLQNLVGLNMNLSQGITPEFVKGIMSSREMFRTIAYKKIDFREQGQQISCRLIDYLDIHAKNEDELFQKGYKEYLDGILLVQIDPDNNFISVSITLTNPDLAAKITNLLVQETKSFLKDYLQKSMYIQAIFLQNRIQNIQDSIRMAENKYKTFLERVINITKPSAVIKKIKLEKQVELYYQVYIELKKQEELIKLQNIEELSDLKVLDKAIPPYKKSKPKRIFVVIVLSGLAFMFILFINAVLFTFKKMKIYLKIVQHHEFE
jgi:hypothetical protein